MKWIPIADIDDWILQKGSDFKGSPFRASIFIRYPSMVWKTEFSSSFLDSYFAKAINESNDFGGFDGLVLGNLARIFNFNITRVVPNVNYGHLLPNATFTGAIGDVLYSRAEAAFNSRFIQDYETNDVEFLYPVLSDRFCIVAPAALRVPAWKAIFSGYHDTAWVSFCICLLICAGIWYYLQIITRCQFRTEFHSIRYRQRTLSEILFEMWLIFLAGTTSMPRQTIERIFICGCLLADIVVIGTFQGSLTKAWSKESYYDNMKTMKNVDDSNLAMVISSRIVKNLFGEDNSTLFESLRSKIIVNNVSTLDQTAIYRNICTIERHSDVNIIMKV